MAVCCHADGEGIFDCFRLPGKSISGYLYIGSPEHRTHVKSAIFDYGRALGDAPLAGAQCRLPLGKVQQVSYGGSYRNS